MSQTQQKKRKKQKQNMVLETPQVSESAVQLEEFLDKLAEEKQFLDVQVCPKCKSPKINRTDASGGDMFGHMGFTPPKYTCSECGYTGLTVLKQTNRPLKVRDVELIAEALDAEE
jgi:ribosomal protein L37AE/L43A